MDDLEVRRVIERAKNNDKEAIAELYERNFKAIYGYFRHRVGSVVVVEDLTSQLFLIMLRALPRYQVGEAPFRSWLFKIARNLVAEHYRRNGAREKSLSLDKMNELTEAGQESALLSKEVEACVREALRQATDEQREVLLLRFYGDLSHREIGALMGKSEAAVKMLQKRALDALARYIGGEMIVRR